MKTEAFLTSSNIVFSGERNRSAKSKLLGFRTRIWHEFQNQWDVALHQNRIKQYLRSGKRMNSKQWIVLTNQNGVLMCAKFLRLMFFTGIWSWFYDDIVKVNFRQWVDLWSRNLAGFVRLVFVKNMVKRNERYNSNKLILLERPLCELQNE